MLSSCLWLFFKDSTKHFTNVNVCTNRWIWVWLFLVLSSVKRDGDGKMDPKLQQSALKHRPLLPWLVSLPAQLTQNGGLYFVHTHGQPTPGRQVTSTACAVPTLQVYWILAFRTTTKTLLQIQKRTETELTEKGREAGGHKSIKWNQYFIFPAAKTSQE